MDFDKTFKRFFYHCTDGQYTEVLGLGGGNHSLGDLSFV